MTTTQLKVTEAQWQQTVIDLARLQGWKCGHFRPARTERGWRTPVAADGAGFPDLVLARPGSVVIFAELKAESGRVSPAQQEWLDVLAAAPGAYAVVWRPSDFDEVQRRLQKEKTP